MRFRHPAEFLCIAAFISLAALRAQDLPAEPKGVSVSGTVINSQTREPVRRAEVTLMPAPDAAVQGAPGAGGARLTLAPATGPQPAGAAKPAPRTVVTGPDGTFLFENVAEGTYRIYVRREGMVAGRPGPGLSPQLIRVSAGTPVTGLRYSLTPQAVISGRVLDDEGEPVQGVQVMALRRAPPEARSEYAPLGGGVQTDDRGEYRLRNLPPGKYLVMATPMGQGTMQPVERQRTALVAAFHPDAASPQQAVGVSAGAGVETANVDIRLRRAPVRRVSGKVFLEDGKPAERFMVTTLDRHAPMQLLMFSRMAMGSEPGSFVLEAVPQGSYTLTARLMDSQNPMAQRVAMAQVEVGDKDIEGVEIRFLPPFTLRGQIRVEGPGAEGQKPQFGTFQITATPVSPGMSFGQAAVKEDGSFEMTLHAPDRYRLMLYQGASPQLYLASIRTSGGGDAIREIDLTSGAPESVIVTLRADAARIIAKRPQAEKPDELCQPYYAAVFPVSEQERLLRRPTAQPVDDSGQAVLFPVAPGEYYVFGLCAADLMFMSNPDLIESMSQQAEKIRVQPGEQKTITLKDVPLPEA